MPLVSTTSDGRGNKREQGWREEIETREAACVCGGGVVGTRTSTEGEVYLRSAAESSHKRFVADNAGEAKVGELDARVLLLARHQDVFRLPLGEMTVFG